MNIKLKTILLIVASFILGGIGGGFIGSHYFPEGRQGRQMTQEDFRKQFRDKLKLDDRQAAAIDTIVSGYRCRFDTVRGEFRKRFDCTRDSMRVEIRKLLTPEQNGLFDEYIKEDELRRKNRH